MKLAIFGLTLSSSWGNGHATLWRGLLRALARQGHTSVFFERDVEYYANHRDLQSLTGAELILYRDWNQVSTQARAHVADADVAIVTSYCADACAAAALMLEAPGTAQNVFYDLDTPVTLARLNAGRRVEYLPERGLADFDLVLSYTGGVALGLLQEKLGARKVAPLYGHADPDVHCPAPRGHRFAADLSYLGTYAADRQPAVKALFVEPARRLPDRRFMLGGSNYPADFPWRRNIWSIQHVAPPEHSEFYCSSRLTLNVTRADMAAMGFCPSGRLFEAAACGVPIVTDCWSGLQHFYTPGEEIIVARDTADVVAAIQLPDGELARIARAAHERTLEEHSSSQRAKDLLDLLQMPPRVPAYIPPVSQSLSPS